MPSRASAAALVSAVWTASSSTTGATGVTYTFLAMPRTTATLSKVTMTVPSGTGGTAALGTVAPSAISGGTVSLSGTTLSYTFTPVSVAAGLVIKIPVTGLTNSTSAAGTMTSTVTTLNGTTTVDSGTASFTFTGPFNALSGVAWTASSTATGVTGVSYTYTFTPASLVNALAIATVKITVPPGTTGTPVVTTSSPVLSLFSAVTLSGNTLTLTGNGGLLSILTSISVTIGGLGNTYTAGSYQPEIVTDNGSGAILDSGVAPAVSFPGGLGFGAPAALTWSGVLNGQNQNLADATAAHELLTVNDQTDSGAGWHVTVSATNFVTAGGSTLPASGVLGVTGSTAGLSTSTAPTAACPGTAFCALPDDTAVTYPVVITSAATSPAPSTVYDATAATGIGPVTIGGSTAANPVGWWVNVPGYAPSGTFSSTVTVSIVSGP